MLAIDSASVNTAPSFKAKSGDLKKLKITCPYSGQALVERVPDVIRLPRTTEQKSMDVFKENIKEYMEVLDRLPAKYQKKVKVVKSIIEKL